MQTYLVGGAVRDKLLGLPVKDRDWVVVGATPQQMLDLGYSQVGADFPVFLHPHTKEEYALARTERKSGVGYKGFVCDFSPDVSLEDDLLRRDLTINAMAMSETGEVIDPYGGKGDLERRMLRHVSDAFREDPLRVLRVARFAARLAPKGFGVAEETLAYMRDMVASGELQQLTPERVWQETERALSETMPWVYIQVLRSCRALRVIMPELDELFSAPPAADDTTAASAGEKSLRVLEQAARLSPNTEVRFAGLVHNLGQPLIDHEPAAKRQPNTPSRTNKSGVAQLRSLSQRLKIPTAHQALAQLACELLPLCNSPLEQAPQTILQILKGGDALRRPERFEQFLLVCEAQARAREAGKDQEAVSEGAAFSQANLLRAALAAARALSAKELAAQGLSGAEIGERMQQLQLEAIANILPDSQTGNEPSHDE